MNTARMDAPRNTAAPLTGTDAAPPAPAVIARARDLVEPALRDAVAHIDDPRMRQIASYQLGWTDPDGQPVDPARSSGKAVRPALCVLSGEAAGDATAGVPAGVAVELVHNFSLLHDDIMDRDTERRHRPTGWVVYGDGQTILAGNAMLVAAIEALLRDGSRSQAVVPYLMSTVQHLISGQSQDLALEDSDDATLDDVLQMEGGKTAALISCAAAIGALAAGAAPATTDGLAEYGRLVGLAFQLVDDVLGIVGDPAVTGKSASSDLRAGKRSIPVVAALQSGTNEARELAALLGSGPLDSEEQIARAAALVVDGGGVQWATDEAARLVSEAGATLTRTGIPQHALGEFEAMSAYLVRRAR